MATNAFAAGWDAKSGKKKQDDDDTPKKSGGSSGAFQRGWDAAGDGKGKAKSTAKKAVKRAQKGPTGLAPIQDSITAVIPSAKHGGKVMKTGLVRVHRGETIVPAGKHHAKKTSRRRVTKIVSSPISKR